MLMTLLASDRFEHDSYFHDGDVKEENWRDYRTTSQDEWKLGQRGLAIKVFLKSSKLFLDFIVICYA